MAMPKIEVEMSPGGEKPEGSGLGDRIIGALTEQLTAIEDNAEAAQVLRDLADIIDEGGLDDAGQPMED